MCYYPEMIHAKYNTTMVTIKIHPRNSNVKCIPFCQVNEIVSSLETVSGVLVAGNGGFMIHWNAYIRTTALDNKTTIVNRIVAVNGKSLTYANEK
ncbi:hypothetical protein RFI_34168 [Reticulomyxa filosa]|uniref:Uncharacterized protein n=1 Tax=Reticulomyxa filosa TaxID=46433 RepID=X6LPD5_RETFI|nr:hypothetical protein RFI_34168 [Reticulomyxa filosa]|eukprot:ETO03241.1 hypothetical protein RFI_34168 [Reticulomyxa filosa]